MADDISNEKYWFTSHTCIKITLSHKITPKNHPKCCILTFLLLYC